MTARGSRSPAATISQRLIRYDVGPAVLRERVAALNGTLVIESTRQGALLEIGIPFGATRCRPCPPRPPNGRQVYLSADDCRRNTATISVSLSDDSAQRPSCLPAARCLPNGRQISSFRRIGPAGKYVYLCGPTEDLTDLSGEIWSID
jgi:hypothetical protein